MCNPAYCDKIEKSEKVIDIATNDRVMHSGIKYDADKLGETLFNKNSLTNIFSFTNLVDKFRITYD